MGLEATMVWYVCLSISRDIGEFVSWNNVFITGPFALGVFCLPFLLPCSVDNSEWMRNGDFIPTRMQAQQDAVNVVCRMKTRQNVENTVGLLSLAE